MQEDARLLRHGQAARRALEVEIERLLAEDRLARAGAGLDQVCVCVGRARDQQRVDGVVGDRPRRRHDTGAVQPRERLRGRGIRVGDAGELGARQGHEVGGVDPADPAGAYEGESVHEAGLRPLLQLSRGARCWTRYA